MVQLWLWQFGKDKPSLWGLSVPETEECQMAVMLEGARRGYAIQTKWRRYAPKAAAE